MMRASVLPLTCFLLALPAQAAKQAEASVEIAYECADTTVKSIGSRLVDGDGKPMPDMGSQVTFTSGIHVVDYSTPKVVEMERAGDKVQVCLIEVPSNCPPGDDRGRVYRVYDYRQKASYTMADAAHMCGGA